MIKRPSGQWDGNLTLTLIFMIPRKYNKKKKKKKREKKNLHLRKYLSCHSTLGRHINRIYRIEPNLHISPSVLPRESCKFCGRYHHLFFIVALIIPWFGQIALLPRRNCLQLLVMYFFFLFLIFFPLPLFP